MPVEINMDGKKKNNLKDIYNDSVKLLELLNVMIPKIDSYDPKIPAELIQAVADKCFELGANLATNADELQEKPEPEPEEEDWSNFPFGS